MYGGLDKVTADIRLAIDVIHERRIGRNRDARGAGCGNPRHLRHRPGEQLRSLHQHLPHRPVIDHDDVQLPVVEFSTGRDERTISVLTRVRDRDEERAYDEVVAVCADRVFERNERHDLACGKLEIAHEATTLEAAFSESTRDLCVKSKTRDVKKEMAVEFTGVDQARAPLEHCLKRCCRVERDAKLPCEPVTRSGWNDRKRGLRFDERRSDFVDGAVTAPCDKQRGTAPARRLCELTRVSRPLGDEDLRIELTLLDQCRRVFSAKTRQVAPPARSGNGIDDDDNFLSLSGAPVGHVSWT